MPKFSVQTDYLKHQDLADEGDTIVTIFGFAEEEIKSQSGDAKTRWVLTFDETEQKLVLNKTNGNLICKALGTDEMNDWKGQKIALYVNHDVQFGAETVSAIRVRSKRPA